MLDVHEVVQSVAQVVDRLVANVPEGVAKLAGQGVEDAKQTERAMMNTPKMIRILNQLKIK